MSDTYAIAIVVGREPPVSSHLGDRAIVHADGRMEGYIGGSCSRDIVRRQALDTLRTGEPRLVRITPDDVDTGDERDVITVPMHCVSEGAVEVYIEPLLPKPKLILAGMTPVAETLSEIAPALGYNVVRFVDDDELCDVDGTAIDGLADYVDGLDADVRARSAAIVASQGHYDDKALTAVLRHELAYVGLLASRVRGLGVLSAVEENGIVRERLRSVHCPAGLALGARKPADVAIAILAQIVAANASRASAAIADAESHATHCS
ncbi:MAG: XdhC family protein [Candidatus Eremiobacteraeota bacterium]|nr:XdhC family protein [Candidatus Eremiobacteraeota bacterium]